MRLPLFLAAGIVLARFPVHTADALVRHARRLASILMLSTFSSAWAALPAPWVDQDIGSVAATGSADYVAGTGTFTVKGSGADIFNSTDAFNYCYQPRSGDFTFTGRLVSAGGTNVNGGAASGLMLRESNAANSRHLMIYSEPGGYKRFVYRNTAGNQTMRFGIASGTLPVWFRITRFGELVHVYWSLDGSTWTQAFAMAFPQLSGTVNIGMGVTSRNNGVINTATFDNISLENVQTSTATVGTTWLGNSWPGGTRAVGFGVASIYVDPSTGKMFANGQSEHYSTTIYDTNGNFIAPCIYSHFKGGYAIAADSSYVYSAQSPVTSGTVNAGIAIYDHVGMSASSTILLPGHNIRGLACNPTLGELYIADSGPAGAGPELIRVFSTSTRTELRNFPLPRGRNLAVAPDNTLWIVQEGDGGANPPKVLHYTTTGTALTGTISGIASPRGIAIASNGLIYVTDTGVDQNVKIYNASGTLTGTFGVLNGIYSGIKGEIAPNKLNNPVGVGVDNSGNIWVACNGPKTPWADLAGGTGATLRKYTLSGGAVQWERFGLEYVDCAAADPATDGIDLFTKNNHYVMDYTKPIGQQWTYKGMTIDQFTYPNDPRLSTTLALGPVIVRRINGKRYLFATDQQGWWLHFFRFEAGSEIAIPLGYMQRQTHRGYPDDRFGIWHDSGANGQIDAGEVDLTGVSAGPPSNETYCFSVDKNGGVWTMDGTSIRCYAPQTDANGNLYYTSGQMQSWPRPAAFIGTNAHLLRAYFDVDNDAMYLAGYTNDAPKPDLTFGLIGTRIIKYSTFSSTGTTNEVYRINVPRDVAAGVGARAMDIDGDYVAFGILRNAEVHLYDATSGGFLTKLNGGPEVGLPGWVDCNNGIQLFTRSNGELFVFTEEDNEAKILLHRYNPLYAGSIGTVQSGSASHTGGTYTLTGASAGGWDNQEFLSRAMTGDGTVIARVVSITSSSGTPHSAALGGIQIRESLVPGSKFVDAVMYPYASSGGVSRQVRSTTGGTIATWRLSGFALPYWVKLVRSGNNCTGYSSPDGITWTAVGAAVSVPMNEAVYVGLMWYSNTTTVPGTVVFDNFSTTP